MCQAIEGRGVGAGNTPIDVIKDDFYSADIKSVTGSKNGKSGQTGEASLGQNFLQEGGIDIDYYFKNKNFDLLLTKWKNILKEKYNKDNVPQDLPMYSIWFVKTFDSKFIDIVIFKINKNDIEELQVDYTTDNSVFIKGGVEEGVAQIKLYKAKRRLEMRLYMKNIGENKLRLNIPHFKNNENIREELYKYNSSKECLINKIENILSSL